MATSKQRKAARKTSENLGSDNPKPIGEILREVGYAPSVSETPTIVTESRGYQEILNELIPDELVTTRHMELLNAGLINHYEFFGKNEVRDVDAKDEDEEFLEDARELADQTEGEISVSLLQRKLRIGYARAARLKELISEDSDDVETEMEPQAHGGSLKRSHKTESTVVIASDEEIKTIIESVPGCKLIYIKQFGTGTKVAYFSQPDNRSRKDAIDMAYKIRARYIPEDAPKTPSQIIGDAVLMQIADQLNEQFRQNNAAASQSGNGAQANAVGPKIQAQD